MKVSEFLREKNKIIRQYTGVTLVPEEQIKDIDFDGPLFLHHDSACCPYCLCFHLKKNNECQGCPIKVAGNWCVEEHSTYEFVTFNYWTITDPRAPWADKLRDLLSRWNQAHGYEPRKKR